MIMRASKRITAGTEVTSSYGPAFYVNDRNERQKALLDPQSFICDCSSCVLEERDGLDGQYFPIGCQKCGSPLTRQSSSSAFRCSRSSCGAKMSRTDAKRLYTRIESLLSSVGHLSESYQQLGGFGQFCTENQLAQWERQLSELSSVKGMRNYWNLGSLYSQLAGDYVQSFNLGTALKALQCLERFCEIKEYNSGITPSLYLHIDRLANLYSEAQDFQRGHNSLYQRVLNRTSELLRLFSLADLQQDNGPDLLVDNATFLWEKHRQLVKTLDGLK